MSISIVQQFGDTLEILDDGVTRFIQRSIFNREYSRLIGLQGQTIGLERDVYNAFPEFHVVSGSLVCIYSSGEGHGNSSRQIMARSDNGGLSWDSVVFFENETASFDFSLLDGLMLEGQFETFKVWTVERTALGFNTYTNSVAEYNGVNYALWSQVKSIGGRLLRTGYGVRSGVTETALFESNNNGESWVFVSMIFDDPSFRFSEADVEEMPNGNLIAVCRQDGENTKRYMWYSFSSDSGLTWTSPVRFNYVFINGTQPNILTIGSNVFLMAGDRTGFSGLDASGKPSFNLDITGVSIWKSSDNGATWTERINAAPMWSTDGGQPRMVEHGGIIKFMYYGAPGASNSKSGVEPGVYFYQLNPDSIV